MRFIAALAPLGHILAAILVATLLVGGIFRVDGLLSVIMIVAAVVVVFLDLICLELVRAYRERSGSAFPGDCGPGLHR